MKIMLYRLLVMLSAFLPVYAEVLRLSPESVVDLARKQSVMALNSEYTVRAAGYSKKGAFTGFLPTVKGNITYTHLDEPPSFPSVGGSGPAPTDTAVIMILQALQSMMTFEEPPQDIWNMSISVTQPLFLGGRVLNAYRASKFSLESEQHAYDRSMDEVRLAALQLFWGYVSASEGLAVAKENQAWLEKLIGTQQIMFENGMIIEHVLLKTKVGLSQAKLAVLRTRNGVENLRESMLLFLDLPLTTEIALDTSHGAPADADIAAPTAGMLDSMVASREDIRAAALRLEAVKTLRKIQVGNYMPSLISAYNQKLANDNYQKIGELDPGWSISLVLDVPILDWGKNYREIQKLDCQIAQIGIVLKSSRERARSEILDAHRKLAESIEELAITREGLENARRALEIAELQYNEGAITHVELHEARKELTGAQAQVIQARTAKELALVRFEVATGK